MSQTVIRGTQILNNTVQRQDLDVSTVGQAVVTKLIQGSGITLSSTGADSGTGDVTVTSPDVVSTDAGNIATLGTDNHILVPQSQITAVRLRSYSSIGNGNFEVDQANVYNPIAGVAAGARVADRWFRAGGGTYAISSVVAATAAGAVLPGTNYRVSSRTLNWQLTTQESSMAAGDALYLIQHVEGSAMRELANDAHSVSILMQSSVAPLTFALAIRDNPVTKSIVYLCTVSTASTWTLLTVPNIPVFPGGNFSVLPGVIGYDIVLCFACGSTFLAPSTGSWLTGNYLGATGMSNWCGSALNSVLQLLFVQHEPGAATTPMDLSFDANHSACLRYYDKSYDYATAIGTVTANGEVRLILPISTVNPQGTVRFSKTLAKLPTMTAYNAVSGAINSCSIAGVATTVNSFGGVGTKGFDFITIPAAAGPQGALLHYVADTGW